MIFFSIIIPSYNRGKLITETIGTVLQQSWPHYEIVVVDDGSTDNTKEVIEKNYANETRVKYFYKRNEERGAARNFGLKQAKGDYAVFIDSDDWMKPHYLETLNEIIEKHPGIYLLAAKYVFENRDGKESPSEIQPVPEGWYDRELFIKGNSLACNFCIRIRDHSYHNFPEDRKLASMEDWLFLLVNLGKEKIFIRDKVCLTMREHEERSMYDNQKVIAARKQATAWALEHIDFNREQQKTLEAWSHYFCGIHHYVERKRRLAMKETLAAIRKGGINKKFLALALKAMVGRKLLVKLK